MGDCPILLPITMHLRVKIPFKELVWSSVEETLSEPLETEAEKLTQSARYEQNEQH